LLTHDDESSHRNPVPIRGGATASSKLFIEQGSSGQAEAPE
jgi:hypothetical protein